MHALSCADYRSASSSAAPRFLDCVIADAELCAGVMDGQWQRTVSAVLAVQYDLVVRSLTQVIDLCAVVWSPLRVKASS
jgi:hypothetical protein